MGYQLGVDLGTTYTAAAVIRNGQAEVATLGTRSLEIPSVAYLRDDGEMLIGEAAERRSLTEPDRFIREFKRRIGDPTPVLLGGSPFSAHTLMAKLLRAVVKVVADREASLPDHTVVTCPANWGDYKRELLDQAVHQADVGATSVLTEPEAAAIHYATTTRVGPGETIAVYDLGGGTFDAAVLRNSGTRFELLGDPQGIEQLGGVYFDDAVFSYVAGYVDDAMAQLDPDDPGTVAAVARLRRDCVEAKEALSWDTDATIPVALPNQRTEVRLTRSEFEEMVRPALAESVESMRRALRFAGVEPAELKAVLLVGGSSRIPLVAQMLAFDLGRPTAIDIHPKHAVALGAAHAAALYAPVATAPAPVAPTPVHLPSAPPTPAPAAPPGIPAAPESPPVGSPRVPPPERPSRLPVIAAVVGAVVLLAGLGWWFGFVGGDDDGGGPPSSDSGSEGEATGTPISLPQGEPLPVTTLAFTGAAGDFWDIWVVDQAGGAPRQVTHEVDIQPRLPVISPDRTTVAYTVKSGQAYELWVVDTAGDQPTRIDVATDLAADARATWSPDGTRLAFVRQVDGVMDLWELDLRSSALRPLTTTPEEEADPAWSPDGESIAFWSRQGGNGDLFLLPVSGGGDPVRLTATEGDDADPAWSPNGQTIAFASQRDGDWDIYVMAADGSAQQPLTDNTVDDQDPAWSPDGGYLAFGSKRVEGSPDDSNIYVMLADGSDQRVLVERAGFDAHPAWGSTPR